MAETTRIPDGPPDRNEAALVAGLSSGDPAAVRDFLRRTHRQVYGMTARLTRDPDLRHDWTQDLLLKIVREMGRGRFVYRHPGCFWSWFKSRARFILLNQYHRHKTHTERWSDGEIGAALVEKMSMPPGTDPLGLLEKIEARRVVEACLAELDNEDHRRALHLILFQEQAYQEVADVMGATLNTVRSWIRRARIAMRRCVAAKFDDPREGGI